MTIDLSVIVPLYNEEENVGPMWAAISTTLNALDVESEVLFVDDGSKDRSFAEAMKLPRDGKPRLRIVKFRRNHGQTAAMAAGIEHAQGRILITMDGDLQNDPGDIPLFLEKIDEGYDLVVGWRKNRKDHWSRVLPSKIANWLIGKVTGVPIKDNGCSLKAYRADLIKEIPLYAEMHRFIPAMASLAAARVAEIEVRHHPRRFGQSKYGFSRIYKVFVDLLAIRSILSFARHPFVWFGVAIGISGVISLLALVMAFVLGSSEITRSSIVFQGLSVLFGAQMLFLLFLAFLSQIIWATRASRLGRFTALAARSSDGKSLLHTTERTP